jgi:hypothetical protein
MSAHLSSEQISKWIAGDRTPDADRHLQECIQCSSEIARLKTVLAEFRSSVVAWSALQKNAEAPERWAISKPRRKFVHSILHWRLAAATLVVIAIVLTGKNISDRHRKAAEFQADVQLWEEVNAQISRPVPASMEPLMNLIAWDQESGNK